MSKHTPGPWEETYGKKIYANGRVIADVMTHEREQEHEDNANARLIASAPELLSALIALRDEYKQAIAGLHMQSSRQLAWTNTDAVIAKATGKKL